MSESSKSVPLPHSGSIEQKGTRGKQPINPSENINKQICSFKKNMKKSENDNGKPNVQCLP